MTRHKAWSSWVVTEAWKQSWLQNTFDLLTWNCHWPEIKAFLVMWCTSEGYTITKLNIILPHCDKRRGLFNMKSTKIRESSMMNSTQRKKCTSSLFKIRYNTETLWDWEYSYHIIIVITLYLHVWYQKRDFKSHFLLTFMATTGSKKRFRSKPAFVTQ